MTTRRAQMIESMAPTRQWGSSGGRGAILGAASTLMPGSGLGVTVVEAWAHVNAGLCEHRRRSKGNEEHLAAVRTDDFQAWLERWLCEQRGLRSSHPQTVRRILDYAVRG